MTVAETERAARNGVARVTFVTLTATVVGTSVGAGVLSLPQRRGRRPGG